MAIVVPELFKEISALDWDDLPSVDAVNQRFLRLVDEDRSLLRDLLFAAAANPALVALSEHIESLDKVVLHDDPAGWRLRLHIFLTKSTDWPHNHRWTFTSRILRGEYGHVLYAPDEDRGLEIDVAAMRPLHTRTEREGDSYTLHHETIHTVFVEPGGVSLIVRGPAVKDRWLVTDRTTGKAWWRHGAANAPKIEVASRRVTAEQLLQRIDTLVGWGVVPARDTVTARS